MDNLEIIVIFRANFVIVTILKKFDDGYNKSPTIHFDVIEPFRNFSGDVAANGFKGDRNLS